MQREMTIQLTVTAPAVAGESEVCRAVDAALDEPPCDWGEWSVSMASVIKVEHVAGEEDDA